MGTRHLIAAVVDGEYKLAQYGQWDGYPEGQGMVVLDFLRNKMDRAAFVAALRDCHFVNWDKEIGPELIRFGAKPECNYFMRLEDYKRYSAAHPEWSRDTGAKILMEIQSRGGLGLKNELAFAGDSLFCEWAYVLDFDKNNFEVYEGFNQNPLTAEDRFFSLEEPHEKYHPVRLRASWPLDDLPQPEDFLAEFEEAEG